MKIALLISFIILSSCSKNKLTLDNFNNSQRTILSNLLKENDSILENKFGSTLANSYYKHLAELKNSENISYALQKSLFVHDLRTCELFLNNDIFIVEDITKFYGNEKIEAKMYNLNFKSPYIKFLDSISKQNQVIEEYNNALKISGSLSPSSTAILLKKVIEDDLANDNIRLILGVHFLLLTNLQ